MCKNTRIERAAHILHPTAVTLSMFCVVLMLLFASYEQTFDVDHQVIALILCDCCTYGIRMENACYAEFSLSDLVFELHLHGQNETRMQFEYAKYV